VAILLNLETSTHNCSVCVSQNGKVLALVEESAVGYIHAEKLHPFITKALAIAEVAVNQLDAISVSNGPGSYTGLRIGVSAAKGLCYALNIPLIAINTTEVLAHAVIDATPNTMIISVLDARRDEVYYQRFSALGTPQTQVAALVLSTESFAELAGNPVVVVGDAADKTARIISLKVHAMQQWPSAANLAALAEGKYQNQQFADLAYHEPFYLKDFIAGKPKKVLE
jgi:tRNA threonylcarbamoyladenosine biosynthesis protein TsaB